MYRLTVRLCVGLRDWLEDLGGQWARKGAAKQYGYSRVTAAKVVFCASFHLSLTFVNAF